MGLFSCKKNDNFPKKETVLVEEFKSYSNFFPLEILNLKKFGINKKIPIDSHKVILSTTDNVFPIWRPTNTKKTAKIGSSPANGLHCVIIEYSQKTILRGHSQKMSTRRKCKLVNSPNSFTAS